jgi:hypothetical protein
MAAIPKGDGWKPAVTLSLDTAGTNAFEEAKKQFAEWSKTQPPPGPIGMQNGWYDITPKIAEDLLRRNIGNRKATLSVVKKYAKAMKSGDWVGTGQPILVNKDGKLEDAAHRCWASYLGQVTFHSYVITDVPVVADLFAYLDDCKPRSVADALYTSGSNGLSGVLAATIKLAGRYDDGTLNAFQGSRSGDMSVREALAYSRFHPRLGEVTHLVMSDYSNAVDAIGHKAVAALFCWKVEEAFGHEVLDDFLVAMAADDLEVDDPIVGYQSRLLKQEKMKEPLKAPHMLALLIKAFQLRAAGQKINVKKGLYLTDSEPFPQIEDAQIDAAMAEAAD